MTRRLAKSTHSSKEQKTMIRSLVAFSLALLMFTGCGGNPPPELLPLDLSGTWSGPDGQGGTFSVTLSHDLSTDSLSGTWTSTGQGVTVNGTLDGTLATRSVSMSMRFEDAVVFTYTGTVESDGTTITGTVRDTDGETNPLNLTKT